MAYVRLDRINVIDIEATCWKGTPPAGGYPEIIEVGIASLSIKTKIVEEPRSFIVKPIDNQVSQFCSELTHITPEMTDGGVSLDHVFKKLKKNFQSHKRIWASWGDWDRLILRREAERKGLRYPFGPRHINIKTLLGLAWHMDREPNMQGAMKRLGMEFEGTPHRGDSDAYNTARLLGKLLEQMQGLPIVPETE